MTQHNNKDNITLKGSFNLAATLLGGVGTFVFGNGLIHELLGHHPSGTDQSMLCLGLTTFCVALCALGVHGIRKEKAANNSDNTPKPPAP